MLTSNAMKTKIIPIIAFFSVIFYSCEDSSYREYTGNSPIYLAYGDLRSSVIVEPAKALEKLGKIYFKDNYIFIVEDLKGIHVFDNSTPSSPVNKAFIKVPGVVDISIAGSIMYADSYIDLVVLDLSDINNIHESGRVKGILPYTVPATGNTLPTSFVDEEKGVVLGWEVKKIRERYQHVDYPIFFASNMYSDVHLSGGSSGISGSGVGIGGSMARFGIRNNVLYVLNNNDLKVFDITDKSDPVQHGDIYPGWGMETMFLYGKNMFLGTTTGMVILDLSVPLVPQTLTFFQHARSCDPVIVDDTLAYITLRTGTRCGGTNNTLSVINIKSLTTPKVVAVYPMVNPQGLGKDGDLLFICDGAAGLKVFDASDPKTITDHLLYTFSDITAYDVIPLGNILVMIGDTGLFQYDYSNISNIHLISSILVSK